MWPTFEKPSNFTINTLILMAKSDNQTEFQSWYSRHLNNKLTLILNDISLQNIVSFLYFHSGTLFLFCDDKWWEYSSKTSLWTPSDNFEDLIMDEIIPKLKTYHSPDFLLNFKVTQLLHLLENSHLRDDIINACKQKFLIPHFFDTCDRFKCFKNCTIELYEDDLIIRSGKPEDFSIKHSNVKFNFSLTWQSEIIINCIKFLIKTFPNQDVFIYAMRYISSFLGNPLPMDWLGEGNYSCYILLKIIKYWLGDYYNPSLINITNIPSDKCKYLSFVSTWKSDIDGDNLLTNTFKIDPNLEVNIPALAEALFWIAVKNYPTFRKKGLNP
jgi:hypothetical protein